VDRLKVVQKEIACLEVTVKTEISPVFVPTRYLLYLLDNSSAVSVVNTQCKLGEEEAKQFKALEKILRNHQRARRKNPCALENEVANKKKDN